MRKCRKMISMIMLMVMLATLTPYQALAAEAPTGSTTETASVVEDTQAEDTQAEETDKAASDETEAAGEQVENEADTPENVTEGTSVSDGENEVAEVPADDPEDESAAGASTTTEVADDEEPADDGSEENSNEADTEDAATGVTSVDIAPEVEPVEKDPKADQNTARGDLIDYIYDPNKGDGYVVVIFQDKDESDVTEKDENGNYILHEAQNPYKLIIRAESCKFWDGTYTYTLPSNITYSVDPNNNLISLGGYDVAKYSVSGNKLTVKFNETILDFQDVTASFDFTIKVGHNNIVDSHIVDVGYVIDPIKEGPSLSKSNESKISSTKNADGTYTDRITWNYNFVCDQYTNPSDYTITDHVGHYSSKTSENNMFLSADMADGIKVTAKKGSTTMGVWTLKAGSAGFEWKLNSSGEGYGWEYDVPSKVPSFATSGAGTTMEKDWDLYFKFTTTVVDEEGKEWRNLDPDKYNYYYNSGYLYKDSDGSLALRCTDYIRLGVGPGPRDDIAKEGGWDGTDEQYTYMSWKATSTLASTWAATDTFRVADYYTLGSNIASNSGAIQRDGENTPEWESCSATIKFSDGTTENVPVRMSASSTEASPKGYYFVLTKFRDSTTDYKLINAKTKAPVSYFTLYNTNYDTGSGIVGKGVKVVINYKMKYSKVIREAMNNLADNEIWYIYNYATGQKNGKPFDTDDCSVYCGANSKNVATKASKTNKYVASYRIKYLPEEDDLSKFDSFVITDKLSSNLSLIHGTVQVLAKDNDEHWHNYDTPIPFDYEYKDKLLTVTISNIGAYYYYIFYDVQLDTNTTGTITYTNEASATINGETKLIEKTTSTLNSYDGSARQYSITVNKVDENNEPLEGATFGLYFPDSKVGKDKLVGKKTTDSEGTVIFATSVPQDIIYTQNQPYYILETDAPEGYKLDSTKHWFVVSDSAFPGYQADEVWEEQFADKDFTIIHASGNTGSGSITVTNEPDVKGDLEVSKTVVSDAAADKNQKFSFTVTLSDKTISGTYGDMTFASGVATVELKGGESKSATGLPAGITYKVTETAVTGFTADKTEATGTISETKSTAAFTNTRDTGSLEVSKTVESDLAADANQKFTFTVTLGDTSINGKYGDMTFTNGKATVELKGGEKATATGLPTGITYTVAETAVTGFTTEKSGDRGTISKTKSTAAFTNTRETGGLKVSKSVSSSVAADKTKKFSFKVELSDKTISGKYGQMTFTNGVAEFQLADGESKTATGLPTTVNYTVTETDANTNNFVTESSGTTGTITKGTTPEAKFTNTKVEGGLAVTKSVSSSVAADKTKKFRFKVELDDKTISGTFGQMTFTKGVAQFQLADGESCTAEGLAKGIKYTVTETEDGQFTTTYTNQTGTIANTVSTATVTNTRKTGGLEVSKTVVSDAAADKDQKFSFTVTLGDTSISGTYGDMTFASGVATVELKGGEKATATGLPTGITYTVAETAVTGFTTEKSGDSGTISETTAKAAFTNTREKGGLEVSKAVVSDKAADADQKFSFTVTLGDKTISGKYGDMTFASGVATVELKGGEKATATGLPTGITYTVAETAVTGFTTEKSGDSGTISKTTAKAAFTNTRETGGLKVSKSVTSSTASDKQKEFSFKVTLGDTSISGTYGDMSFTDGAATFKLKDGESKTATGLPTTVTYTVTETKADGFVTTSTGTTGAIEKSKDGSVSEAKFTNAKVEGGLAVTKSVTSVLAADKTKKFSFKVTLDDKTVSGTYGGMTFTNGVAEFTLADGESCAAEGLADGIGYTVTETADGKFTTTYTGATGKVDSKNPATAAFTNTRKTGGLEVSKTVVSDAAADKDQKFSFTVTLSDKTVSGTFGDMSFDKGVATVELKGGESKSATGLPTGITYTVAETAVTGFTTEKSGDSGTISETKATAAFTNTREKGGLEVSKTVESDLAADADQKFSFTVTLGDTTISGKYGDMTFASGKATVELKGGESKSATGLPTGITYTVAETAVTGFTTEKSGDSGTISKTTAKAAFTNTREKGGLKVSKSVTSSTASDKQKKFSFKVELGDKTISGTYGEMEFTNGVAEFQLADTESKTATGLPTTVTYTVTETKADGFATTSTGTTGAVAKDTTPEAKFTNAKVEGGLAVTKSVTSVLAADKTKEFGFTVTLDDKTVNGTYGDMTFKNGVAEFTLADGESCVAEGLAKGIGYTVTETADGKFTTTSEGETGTIDDAAVSTAAFTNTRKTGDLEVSKTLVSDRAADASQTFNFTVTLDDKTVSGTFGDMSFDKGVATVELKGGESKSAKGLPTEIGYTVTEEAAAGFTTGKTGDTGTISTKESTAVFTNTRETGDLEVTKTVVNKNSKNTAKEFSFKVTLSDTTISKTYGDMTFKNGVAEFKLKDGEKATATGLPTEISYTVEETAETGFTTVKTGDTGDISKTKSTAAFTNTYTAAGNYAPEVKKALKGRPLEKDQFTFTLTDEDGNELQAKNDAAGTVYFDEIEYDQDDMDKDENGYLVDTEVRYTAKEVIETKDGYTYSEQEYTITVTLHDKEDGTIEATADKTPADWVFDNTYEAEGKIELPALKKLLGERALEEGQFTFELKDADGNVLSSKTNAADGSVLFDAIEYDQDDVYEVDENGVYSGANVKTYNYTISEVIPEGATDNGDGTYFKDGYTYDGTVYAVAVEITDNGDGTITAVVAGSDEAAAEETDTEAGEADGTGTEATDTEGTDTEGTDTEGTTEEASEPDYVFANAYDANGTLKLDAEKIFDHGVLKGGEFTFELKDADGNVLQSKTNDAAGNVSFEMLTYDMEDLAGAPYVYTVSEVIGDEEDVEFDETVYTVTVSLADNGDGTLNVTKEIDNGGELKFTNYQLNVETSINLGGVKVLKGKDLKDGQFTFVLADESGKKVLETTNNAAGNFEFDAITYKLEDLEGEKTKVYIYGISEVNDKQSGINYDKKVYTVKVTVTDNGDGTMTAKADTSNDEVKFVNTTYDKTGDEANGGLWALILAMAGSALGGTIFFRRRRRI